MISQIQQEKSKNKCKFINLGEDGTKGDRYYFLNDDGLSQSHLPSLGLLVFGLVVRVVA